MNTLSLHPALSDRSVFLRRVLLIDAVTCFVSGALMALDSGPLSASLGIPAVLLFYAGISLFPIAAFMLWVATRQDILRAGAWLAIAGNVGWALGSALVLVAVSTTTLGSAFVVIQGVVTALLAGLEFAGLRRVTP